MSASKPTTKKTSTPKPTPKKATGFKLSPDVLAGLDEAGALLGSNRTVALERCVRFMVRKLRAEGKALLQSPEAEDELTTSASA